MRVRAVEHRHRLPQKVKLGLIRLISGRRVPNSSARRSASGRRR